MNGPHILIPAKGFGDSKRRLAPMLSKDERAALSAHMLERTLRIVRQEATSCRVTVVSGNHEVARRSPGWGADAVFASERSGLNEELADAAIRVPAGTPILVIHADLPRLRAADIRALLECRADIAIAPDHAGTGTNALLLHKVETPFFAFGPGSFDRHCRTAQERGLSMQVCRRTGLAHDLDEPADLRALPQDGEFARWTSAPASAAD